MSLMSCRLVAETSAIFNDMANHNASPWTDEHEVVAGELCTSTSNALCDEHETIKKLKWSCNVTREPYLKGPICRVSIITIECWNATLYLQPNRKVSANTVPLLTGNLVPLVPKANTMSHSVLLTVTATTKGTELNGVADADDSMYVK
jgi:hypothetical protein